MATQSTSKRVHQWPPLQTYDAKSMVVKAYKSADANIKRKLVIARIILRDLEGCHCYGQRNNTIDFTGRIIDVRLLLIMKETIALCMH